MRTVAERARAGLSRRQATALLLATPLWIAAGKPEPVDEEALRQAYAFTMGLG